MTDREEVINGLEQFISDFRPFVGNKADWQRVDDALVLLEEQEPVKPYLDYDGFDVWRCGACGTSLFHHVEDDSEEDMKNYVRYCKHCGRAVKWDD